MKLQFIVTSLLALALVMPQAFAADTDSSSDQQTTDAAKKKDDKAAAEEANNARAKAQEGSKSKFSGQMTFNYTGSSLNHPFSAYSPNPTNTVPAPVVNLQGLITARYRIDDKTTVGVGSGITAQHPMVHPLVGGATTIANPQVDLARSFKTGPLRHYLDIEAGYYTDKQNHKDIGATENFTIADEIHYEWSFGLTTGLALELDANMFSNQAKYNSGINSVTGDPMLSDQTGYDYCASPYVEYALSKTFNLRSVSNICGYHTRDLATVGKTFVYQHGKIDETLGLGSVVSEAVFLYTYIRMTPFPYSHVRTDNTLFGFSTIINLF